MKIALAQLSLLENMEANLQKALNFMEAAALKGAEAICFPEVQLSPFFPQYPEMDASKFAIPIDHQFITILQEKCRSLKMVGFPNIYLQQAGNCYDASPVIDSDGSLLGVSKMVHIVQAPNFYEQDYYSPSDSGFKVFDTAVAKVGVVICFDRHFPESIRSCVLKGAELIVIPTANTKGEPLTLFEWELRVAAVQNGVFIAMCNRVGMEGQMDFCGQSIVVDPNGGVLAKADDREQILYAELDIARVIQAQKERPYLALRRPEMYG
jgi:predicted amidohydrolase